MDLYECPVCLFNMLNRNPRFLQCHHTFCSDCLNRLLNNKTILCPTCRKVTTLQSDDIKELTVNFWLQEMKERENKEKAATATPSEEQQPKPLCQICKKQDPVFYCTSCPRAMCAECKNKHSKVSSLKSHTVCELCKVHQDGVTHLCKQCVRPLCMQCMLMEHMEHEKHFVRYDEGVQELQEKVKAVQRDINTKTTEKEESLKDDPNIQEQIITIIHKLEGKEAFHEAKVKEARQYIQEAKSKLTQYSKMQEDFTKLKTECSVANASLSSLVTSTADFCERYTKLMEKAQQALDKMKSLSVTDLLPPFEPQDPCNCEIVKPRQPKIEEIRDLKLSKLGLHKEKSDDIDCKEQGVLLGNDVLFVNKGNHVIRFNQEGRLVDRYYPAGGGDVCGVSVYDTSVYIVQSKAITVIEPSKLQETLICKPNVDNISKILVKDKNIIYLVNNKSYPNGKIYRYHVQQDNTDVMVDKIYQPHYICMTSSPEGIRYIVTAYGRYRIYVYNAEWKLIHQFGPVGDKREQLRDAHSTTVTKMNTLLIADCGNCRVCHYTVDGTLLSHVLTDGIGPSAAIVYNKPYMWVASEYVKCFELQ